MSHPDTEPMHQQWKFNSIVINHTISSYHDFGSFRSNSNEEFVRLHFGLRGDYSFKSKQLQEEFDLIGGHHNIMYTRGLDMEVKNKSHRIETFGVNFPKELFIQFTGNGDDILKTFTDSILESRNSIMTPNWGTINPPIQNVIDEILQNPYSGEIRNIFLMAKSLELLVLCVDNYRQREANSPIYVKSTSDKERLMAARDFVNDRISNPPNLSEISKYAGINEFKLKNGFKEMFDSTIFNYLSDRRLNMAKQILINTDKTAAQIANDLGFSSPQHFSNKFRQKFGMTPKSIRKNP